MKFNTHLSLVLFISIFLACTPFIIGADGVNMELPGTNPSFDNGGTNIIQPEPLRFDNSTAFVNRSEWWDDLNDPTDFTIVGDEDNTFYRGDGSNLSNVPDTITAKVGEVGGIIEGQAVYVSGASGDKPVVYLANNQEHQASHTLGIAGENASLNQNILIYKGGLLINIDTSIYNEGCRLHLGIINGTMDCDIQVNGSHLHMGWVVKSNAGEGILEVEISDYVHDVQGVIDENVSVGGYAINYTNYDRQTVGFMDMLKNESYWLGDVCIGCTSPENNLDVRDSGNISASLVSVNNGLTIFKLLEGSNLEPVNDFGGTILYDGAVNIFTIGTMNDGTIVPAINISRNNATVNLTGDLIVEETATIKNNITSGLFKVYTKGGFLGVFPRIGSGTLNPRTSFELFDIAPALTISLFGFNSSFSGIDTQIYELKNENPSNGGTSHYGYCEDSTPCINFISKVGTVNNDTNHLIAFNVFDNNGAGGDSAVSDNTGIAQFQNANSPRVTIQGNGNITTTGNLFLDGDGTGSSVNYGDAPDSQTYFNGASQIWNALTSGIGYTFQSYVNYTFDNDTEITGDFNQTQGNATFNMIYGQMSFHNDTTANVTTIGSADTWFNITAFGGQGESTQVLNGFAYGSGANPYLKSQVDGLYDIGYHASVTGTVNNKYHLVIAVNNVIYQNVSETHFRISAGNDIVPISIPKVLIRLNQGDLVTLQVLNEDAANDLTVLSTSLTATRIGN